jgi:hypothetical protein
MSRCLRLRLIPDGMHSNGGNGVDFAEDAADFAEGDSSRIG